jgi:hypothetical protein
LDLEAVKKARDAAAANTSGTSAMNSARARLQMAAAKLVKQKSLDVSKVWNPKLQIDAFVQDIPLACVWALLLSIKATITAVGKQILLLRIM